MKINKGIYRIRNIINNKYYIGSSINIERRWSRHLKELKKNKHINIKLQRAWNKYNEKNFVFEIIEKCSIKKLKNREQYYIDLYNSKIYGYNIGDATFGDVISNHPNKNQIVENISKGMKLRYEKMTKKEKEEFRLNLVGKKNPNYGKMWTDKQKRKQSRKLKKYYKENGSPLKGIPKSKEHIRKISEFAKTRIGEKNGFYGKRHSKKTRKILREKRLGKKPSNIKPFYVAGKLYLSLNDASKELRVHKTTIRYRLVSKTERFKNYQYKS